MVAGMGDNNQRQSLQEGLIFGAGNPLLDIVAEVPVDFVRSYGMEPNSAILGTDKEKNLCQEMVEKFRVEYVPGGACLNALRGCQWMLQKPKVAVFMGAIGDDKFGRIMRERAELAGVDPNFQISKDYPSGTCAVLSTEHGRNRSLCAFLNAAEHFDQSHLKSQTSVEHLQNARIIYVTGFFLTHALSSALEIMRAGMQPDKTTMFNLSAPFIPTAFYKNVMELLPFVDVVFGNDNEYLLFAESSKFGTTDLAEIAEKTALLPYNKRDMKNNERTVIITNGSEPTIVFHKGKLSKIPIVPVENVLDSNGAGDAFVGGFLSQYVQGKDIEQCIAGAHYAASVVVQHMGCAYPGIPNFAC